MIQHGYQGEVSVGRRLIRASRVAHQGRMRRAESLLRRYARLLVRG